MKTGFAASSISEKYSLDINNPKDAERNGNSGFALCREYAIAEADVETNSGELSTWKEIEETMSYENVLAWFYSGFCPERKVFTQVDDGDVAVLRVSPKAILEETFPWIDKVLLRRLVETLDAQGAWVDRNHVWA